MLNISVIDNVSPSLAQMAHNLQSLPLAKIAEIMVDGVMRNFQEEGREYVKEGMVTGGPWEPRKEPTGDWPLLNKTGDLMNSIWTQEYQSGSDAVVYMDAGETYGNYLNQGTTKMVARPFLVLSEEEWTEIENVIDEHMGMI